MNSTQQQCFLLAAEHMNFTRAAEQLYITQPALSRNISALEEELEILLFVRHNNVLHITPGGQILYEWMRKAEQDFSQVLETARQANAQPRQSLHVGFVKSELPPLYTAQALQRLRGSHPELEISLTHYPSRDIISRLEEHSMDIAVMIGSAAYENPRLVTRSLSRHRRCIAVSINHPLALQERLSIAELGDETFVSIRPQVSPTLSAMVRKVCATAGFIPKLLEARDTDEQMDWIASRRGVGLLVDNHVQQQNPLFSFIPLEEDFPVELVCSWDRLNTNPHIPEFVEALDALS